jgi:hypothetical protein
MSHWFRVYESCPAHSNEHDRLSIHHRKDPSLLGASSSSVKNGEKGRPPALLHQASHLKDKAGRDVSLSERFGVLPNTSARALR